MNTSFQVAVIKESAIIGIILPSLTPTPVKLCLTLALNVTGSPVCSWSASNWFPYLSDDRHTETRLAEPKCPAHVPLVKNKHVPLEK